MLKLAKNSAKFRGIGWRSRWRFCETTEIQMLFNGLNTNTGTIAQGYAARIIAEYNLRKAAYLRVTHFDTPPEALYIHFRALLAFATILVSLSVGRFRKQLSYNL